MRCLVIVEKAETNYSASVPDLPGCAAQGRSPGEVHENIRAAIALHLAGLRKEGLPVPTPQARGVEARAAESAPVWLRRGGCNPF